MRSLVSFFVRHPVVANLVALVLVGSGLVFGTSLRREFFPEVRPNMVSVTAPYPGASPDEVEQSLALKIEDAVKSINEIEEINTTVIEGACSLMIEFKPGIDIEEAVAKVKREVDALQDLPEESDRIVVGSFEPNLPVISLNLVADTDERLLKKSIRQIRDDLEQLEGMGDIIVSGIRTDEIVVEVRPSAMLEHRIPLTLIADRVREAMQEIPAGSVRSSTANISVRTVGADESPDEVRNIIVKASTDGTVLRLKDVADVNYGFSDVDVATRLSGTTAVSVTAYKVADEDAIEIAAMVRAYAAGRMGEPLPMTWRERLASGFSRGAPASGRIAAYERGLARADTPPPGELVVSNDLSRFISGRLNLLSRNALWGGILVFITLLLLLNLRVALWVTLGLVVSVLGTLAFMHFAGITLNLLTMFGLIIVLGLLVDDAIVVAENITARHEAGEPALAAATNGTRIVAWPVVATVATTVFAFGSLALIEGQIGDLMAVLPMVVMVALSVSLIEALFVLPSHMAHSLALADRSTPGRIARFMRRMDDKRSHIIQNVIVPRYLGVLGLCLRHRYIALMATLALFVVSVGMVASGRVSFTFLGDQDAETVMADLEMPVGTPFSVTDRVVRRLEGAIEAQGDVIKSAFTIVGGRSSPDGRDSANSSSTAQIWIDLVEARERNISSDQIIENIRRDLGELRGVRSLRLTPLQGGPEGPDLNYTVASTTPSRIFPVVDQVEALLGTFEGVRDIANDADDGQRELRITLLPGARELGLTNASVARQVRGFIYGLEPHTFAAPDEDVDVRVMIDRSTRRSLGAIEAMHVFTPGGEPVPLSEVARLEDSQAYATVRRLDRRRVVNITADVAKGRNAEEIYRSIGPELARIEASNPGVSIVLRGRQKEVADSLSTLPLGILASCALIYVCLAWLFDSYVQPLVVLCAVPFALIGMIWGHWLLGFDLTLLSLIGFIALTGVVVNDALIFIEFYNHKRHEGVDVMEAAIEAGRARFRAIVLTTTTTVLGLTPLLAETSFQAAFLKPMAVTICGGLLSATLIVLIVTPCLLLIGRDVRVAVSAVWHGRIPEGDGPGPGLEPVG